MTLDTSVAASLRAHLAMASPPHEAVAAQQALHGRRLAPLEMAGGSLHVRFESRPTRRVRMQWRVRCAGLEVDVQFVDPQALLDLGCALDKGVPPALQCAAVLHSATALLDAVERHIGAPVELVTLCRASVPWCDADVLGLSVAICTRAPTGETVTREGRLLLRPTSLDGWHGLRRAAAFTEAVLPGHDVPLLLTLQCDPVPLRVGELARVEVGDVLLLGPQAGARSGLVARLHLGRRRLSGVAVHLHGGQARVSVVPAASHEPQFSPDEDAPTSSAPPSWSLTMHTTPTADHPPHDSDAPRDMDLGEVQVQVEVELARITLSLAALRDLAVGQVLETHQPVDGDTLVLWCGGQRIGSGRLVAVGDSLGVRVSALRTATAMAMAMAATTATAT